MRQEPTKISHSLTLKYPKDANLVVCESIVHRGATPTAGYGLMTLLSHSQLAYGVVD